MVQERSSSKRGPRRLQRQKKKPKYTPPVWDPFRVFFGAEFQDISGTPFFRFFDKSGPQNGTKTGSLFEALDLAQV